MTFGPLKFCMSNKGVLYLSRSCKRRQCSCWQNPTCRRFLYFPMKIPQAVNVQRQLPKGKKTKTVTIIKKGNQKKISRVTESLEGVEHSLSIIVVKDKFDILSSSIQTIFFSVSSSPYSRNQMAHQAEYDRNCFRRSQ